MRIATLAAAPLTLLAACHGHADWGDQDGAGHDKNVHIAMDQAGGKDHVSVNIPGFDAKVALPAIDLGKHVDLDGIKVAPDTVVRDIDIVGHDHGDGGGQVKLSFTNPQAPAALADYYRRSAADAGYGSIAATGDAVTASKGGKRFALSVAPQDGGSRGTIVMSGGD